LYNKLLSFSGWSLFGSATNVVTQKGFIFLVNIFYGLSVNAALGIANQVNTAVFNFVNSFASSYRPQIVKSYAKDDKSHLYGLISATSRISFSLMLIPILILIFNMPLILSIWLSEVPSYTAEFCQIILVCTLIDATTTPYNTAIMATARIKNYQLWISFSYVLDIAISYSLIMMGVLPYVVFVSRIFTRGFLNAIIGLCFVRCLVGFPIMKYLHNCILPICIILIILLPFLVGMYKHLEGFTMLLYSTLFITLIGATAIYFLMLSQSERMQLHKIVHNKLLRKQEK